MRIGGKIGTGFAVLALAIGTAAPAGASPRSPGGAGTETITLISGDQVVVHRGTARSIRPGAGRESMTFSRFAAAGHSYVIPADAMRLVAAGRLDRRLFDITTLIEYGYDDARRDTLPLIVTRPAGQAAPRVANTEVSQDLPSVNGTALAVDKAGAGAAWGALTDGGAVATLAAGVDQIWLDGKRKSTLDRSTAQIGAPAAWEAGYTGEGVTVAVLDTGVDQTHPDLADREIAEQNFSDAEDNVDHVGHGTHVASTVAGTGARSAGRFRGVAPGASILDGKVLNDFGGGQESWIIAGMEWAAQQGADVANLSLGGYDTAVVDPLEQAVSTLTEQYDTLFVVAAGNSGPGEHTIGSPGSAPEALTVGAVERTDALAPFSSRGPTEQGGVIKPDVTAPGVDIVAALHADGTIAPPAAPGYAALSGTSMATPHVAGAVALLAQQHPDRTAAQLKAALSASAEPTPGAKVFDQGAGRVDVERALGQTVVTEPASVHVGTVAWPHDDDEEPVSRTVTYHNLGDTEVTLELAVEAVGPDGDATDVFSLSADRLTVPADDAATVTITGDTRLGTVDGHYTGAITATAGGLTTRTPVVVTREVESYDLTVNVTGEDGLPTGDYGSFLFSLDRNRILMPYDADGSATVRLPRGRYLALHTVYTDQGRHANAILQPSIDLDQDSTVEVSPAIAKPVKVTPPVAATLELGDIGFQLTTDSYSIAAGPITTDLSTVSTGRLGEAFPDTVVTHWVSTQWSGTDGAFYGFAWFPDTFPDGFDKTVSRRELATVRATIGDGGMAARAIRGLVPQPLSGSAAVFTAEIPVPTPGTSVEHVNTDGVRWRSVLNQFADNGSILAVLQSPPRDHVAGRTYRERMNHAVFGPDLTPVDAPAASRDASGIFVNVPMFSDADGNAGFSVTGPAETRLYLGEELVGSHPDYAFGHFTGLPAESRTYRLATEAVRLPPFALTTAISAEWTFTSSHVDGSAVEPIDLNVVRFLPKLDESGNAPAGRRQLVPLRLQDETGATVTPRRLTVEASYDEGASWRRVPVSSGLVATLHHPAGAASVSLRASATDREGNTVKQTVIRAYTLR
ncbi:S8 family peptidase [Actinophytocola sediminis]